MCNQIEELRERLKIKAKEVEGGFLNNSVIKLSKKLDKLIIKKMRNSTN
ncbi:MAG: Spo0E family sporulation regulatory protein-aspartic acid phosphatase [Bacillota bacterium]